jgi:RNA polymerase sigma factor (sigma-70 family)
MRRMNDGDWLVAAFESHRAHLRAVAYRMLGSMSDAEDAVQDTWLRLSSADPDEVANLGGWLTTVCARISLNMLRSRRRRHEEPVGDSWPATAELAARPGAAVVTAAPGADGWARAADDPEDEVVLADSVGVALLVVLDTLTPAERLAFVLHDLFAMPFTEVAEVLGRTPDATRQLASRARRRVRGAPPGPDRAAGLARQREITEAFLAATRGGDLAALVELLDHDVRLHGDAAATPSGRPAALRGVAAVSRGAIASGDRAVHSQLALVDGNAAIVYAPGGQLQTVLVLTVSPARRVTEIDIIADPERLERLEIAILPDGPVTA